MNIFSKLLIGIFCVLVAACSGGGHHHFNHSSDHASMDSSKPFYIKEKKRALPPFGYVDFCMREPAECPEWDQSQKRNSGHGEATASISTSNAQNVQNTTRKMPAIPYSKIIRHLRKVNNIVNIAVKSVTDPEGFGVTENWRVPDISSYYGDIGDCEDFALLKRKILAQSGFDYNKLSMSVVRQPNGNIHAVLLVRTQYGDFVLDNLDKSVKKWHDTDYTWMKKQSFRNPALWVNVGA